MKGQNVFYAYVYDCENEHSKHSFSDHKSETNQLNNGQPFIHTTCEKEADLLLRDSSQIQYFVLSTFKERLGI